MERRAKCEFLLSSESTMREKWPSQRADNTNKYIHFGDLFQQRLDWDPVLWMQAKVKSEISIHKGELKFLFCMVISTQNSKLIDYFFQQSLKIHLKIRSSKLITSNTCMFDHICDWKNQKCFLSTSFKWRNWNEMHWTFNLACLQISWCIILLIYSHHGF